MDANEFRAEIAGIFREQDRRMEKLDKKIEKNAQAINKLELAVEKNTVSIEQLTRLWTEFIETYSIRDVKKDASIEDLGRRVNRIERKLGLKK